MAGAFADLCRLCGAAAMGRLGWTPEQFWAATPAELLMALGGSSDVGGAGPLDLAGLDRLEREMQDE